MALMVQKVAAAWMLTSAMLRIKSQGFSLIEILVVVVILAATLSMAIISIGSGNAGRQADKQLGALRAQLNTWQDAAYLNHREYALGIHQKNLALLKWEWIDSDDPNEDPTLVWSVAKQLSPPEDFEFEIHLSDDRVLSFNELTDEDTEDQPIVTLGRDGIWAEPHQILWSNNDLEKVWVLSTDGLNPYILNSEQGR